MVRHPDSPADISIVAGALPAFLAVLEGRCRGLPADELTSLDRVVERKLWEIDRADVHAVTGGSDDGFLYSRGFAVEMGREFYVPCTTTRRWACHSPSARRCATSSRTSPTSSSGTSPIQAQAFPVNRART